MRTACRPEIAASSLLTLEFINLQKEPSPGARHKRASLNVKLSVFGTTIPEEKLAFSGDGESGVEAEVPDKGMDAEVTSMAKDAKMAGHLINRLVDVDSYRHLPSCRVFRRDCRRRNPEAADCILDRGMIT